MLRDGADFRGGVVVDPVSLTVGAVIAALVSKAAEQGGVEVAEGASSGLGRLVGWLRSRFYWGAGRLRRGTDESSREQRWRRCDRRRLAR